MPQFPCGEVRAMHAKTIPRIPFNFYSVVQLITCALLYIFRATMLVSASNDILRSRDCPFTYPVISVLSLPSLKHAFASASKSDALVRIALSRGPGQYRSSLPSSPCGGASCSSFHRISSSAFSSSLSSLCLFKGPVHSTSGLNATW